MKQDQQAENIYVDLDSLLDTRLGTLALMGSQYPIDALKNNYHQRQIDEFPGVTRQEFIEAYSKRNVDTLIASVATNAFLLLQACVKGTLEDKALGGQNNGICFVVNYFPYDLEPEEVDEMRLMILARTGNVADVQMVSIREKDLTPRRIKTDYALMIKYDYVPWYEMHLDAIQETPIPGVTLIAPALYFNAVPNQQEMDELAKDKIHPFHATEVASAPVISLKLLNVSTFSVDSDIKPRKPKSPGPDA